MNAPIDNRRIYDANWSAWSEMKIHGPASRWLRALIRAHIVQFPDPENIRAVLDVGCGEGTITNALAEWLPHAQVTGIDFSEAGIQCAESRYRRANLRFVHDEESKALSEQHDLVTAFEVLEHVEDWEGLLRRMAGSARQFILLSFPTGRMRSFEKTMGHYRNFERGEVEQFMSKCGFRSDHCFYAGFPFFSPLYRDICDLSHPVSVRFIAGRYGIRQKIVSSIFYFLFRVLSTRRRFGDQFCGSFSRTGGLGVPFRLHSTSSMLRRTFDFGRNWEAFSRRALTSDSVEQAKNHFDELLRGIELKDRSFLDIGFGQGLSILAAACGGARPVGCDINEVCAKVLRQNQARHFPQLSVPVPIVVGSILDETVVESLRTASPDSAKKNYDIVHSWGALHHTGDLQHALRNAVSLVGPEGYFIVAIYRRHWSSGVWRIIKRGYNGSPAILQRIWILLLCPIIFMAKWLVTRRNPLKQRRGMDFYYNLVDWVGGYPYEHATAEDFIGRVTDLGFELERFVPANVPTGCNEFIFRRKVAAGDLDRSRSVEDSWDRSHS
jgi:2-polyprenyl-3-methyl-5-hydroxy-6-metoxy-1,4-benzoquinol methylase